MRVLSGFITGLARSILSVRSPRVPKSKTRRRRKTKISANVSQDTSNQCAHFQCSNDVKAQMAIALDVKIRQKMMRNCVSRVPDVYLWLANLVQTRCTAVNNISAGLVLLLSFSLLEHYLVSWKFQDLENPGKSLWSWKVLEIKT